MENKNINKIFFFCAEFQKKVKSCEYEKEIETNLDL